VPKLQQGSIIWAVIPDPNGENPKERPAVVVTATEAIQPESPIAVVAVTGTLPKPLPEEYVELPWHRAGHPVTALKKRCAALCRWILSLRQDDIKECAGVVPTGKMVEIMTQVREITSRLPDGT
jgi:mRNA-degrading endonuclease toxin of MazEF toxin-antitoxin module